MSRKNGRKECDILVVGGGASGLMAAISAAGAGARTLVLDHAAVPGKKLLSTGNGKCNFTNMEQGIGCYRSDDPAFVMSAIGQFGAKETVRFFEGLGVYSRTKNGYCYPRSGQAATIREALLLEAARLGVTIRNEVGIQKIKRVQDGFQLQTKSGRYDAKCCILATGGKAAPKTGSDGSGYIYAMQLGHSIVEPLPALVPLISGERWLKDTAGVRCDTRVSLFADGELLAEDTGEVQMTNYGISGIPVFQVSRFASVALAERKKVCAALDFLPEKSREELADGLLRLAEHLGVQKNWYQILCGFTNSKIAGMICKELRLLDEPVLMLAEKTYRLQLQKIVKRLKETEVSVIGTRRMEQAQVTCGGVPLAEIGADMQSKKTPGLYFAGEILNVDGICGGYNLQWAWSSGYLAGRNAALGREKENYNRFVNCESNQTVLK